MLLNSVPNIGDTIENAVEDAIENAIGGMGNTGDVLTEL